MSLIGKFKNLLLELEIEQPTNLGSHSQGTEKTPKMDAARNE
jgi:hypothetical protein